MKQRTKRRLFATYLMGALSLAGCKLLTPDAPPSVNLPKSVYSFAQEPGGALQTEAPGTLVSSTVAAKPVEAEIPPPDPPPGPKDIEVVKAEDWPKPKEVTPLVDKPVNSGPVQVSKPGPAPVPVPVPDSIPEAVAASPLVKMVPPMPEQAPMASAGHAEDYSWLVGEVEKIQSSRSSKGWRLRFARVDQEDQYGGSVLLVTEGTHLERLQEGQRIRVTGRLLNPETKASGTPFEVESLTIVSQ